ncbi:O-antigen ligase [Erysipelothrix urinaevulpis]|uniref:O-antigen ligase family protein n=1 Tax=Erysipelothrix urinaevulpis TaxID=2683717 RepID=UPI0013572B4B|nr:O-antigen ligase family protein [Erysipelothrix urinaevulpis]
METTINLFNKIKTLMSENSLFLLVFILFLPDYALYPAMGIAWIFVMYEFFKYKGFNWSFFWLLLLYLMIVSLVSKNYKGFAGALYLIILYAYGGSIKRRVTPKTYMELQFYIVFSSLFNFFFNFIHWRPSWYDWFMGQFSWIIDFGGLPFYGDGYMRAYSTFDNPNFYAFILLIVLLVCFNQIQFQLTFKNYKLMFFYIGAFIINFYALLLTGTRSILVALGLGLVTILLAQRKWMQLKVLIFLGAAAVLFIMSNASLFPRFMQISQHSEIRFTIWETALTQIQKEPWFGKGLFTYEFLFDRSDAHNIFIESFLSMGIMGTFIFLVYVIEKIYYYYNNAYYLDYPLALSVIISTIMYGIFDIPLFAVQTSMLFIAVLCLPTRDKEFLKELT